MLSFHEISSGLRIPFYLPNASREATRISIDTRTLAPGDFFVAVRGKRTDGHAHLEEAFRKGACGALIENAFFELNRDRILSNHDSFFNLLTVPDSGRALLEIAKWYRKKWNIPVFGITGSVGKTTTKDFLHYFLGKEKKGIATAGNQNNELGVPLTLLRLSRDSQYCVCELGASAAGEIRLLAETARPTSASITGIAPVHLEGFGSLEKIYQAKLELFESLNSQSVAVVPDHDAKLIQLAKRYPLKIFLVGESDQSDYRIEKLEAEKGRISFHLNGRHFAFPGEAVFLAHNAALAIALAVENGFDFNQIPEFWDDLTLSAGRFEIFRTFSEILFINDSYNASPLSFLKAVEAFDSMKVHGRKILVISDMLELGRDSQSYHELLGRQISEHRFHGVVAYGHWMKRCLSQIRSLKPEWMIQEVSGAQEAADFLRTYLAKGDAVLLKGSHSMQVDQVMNLFKKSNTPIHGSGLTFHGFERG